MIRMIYGEKLKSIRTREGLTQEELAKLIDVSKSLYSRYEKEIQLIPAKHLITICNHFDVSIDYIFNLNDKKQYPKVIPKTDKIKAGLKLKEFRKENNLTQEKLANILNTTQSVIADYERGRYLIATPFLYQICKTYHVSADYLLGKIDDPKYLK